MEVKNEINLSESEKNEILNTLPVRGVTLITNYVKSNKGLYMELRTDISNKEEALAWKTEFEEKTKTTYIVDSTFADNTEKTLFKRVYHCLHNTRPKKVVKTPHPKHTKCPAKLIINVKQRNMQRSKDVYLKMLPCKITIRQHHNHSLESADVLCHRKPNADVKRKFVEFFSQGHTPLSALKCFKLELKEEYGDDYFKVVADGSKCPKKKWCYQLYYKRKGGDSRLTNSRSFETTEEFETGWNTLIYEN